MTKIKSMKLSKFISSKFWDTENKKFLNFAKYFSIVSIAIGALALIISLSVLDGYDKELRGNAIKFTSHILLQNFNRNPINVDENIEKINSHFNNVTNVQPIIQNEALIKSDEATEGIFFRGIPENYNILNLKDDIQTGKFDLSGKNKIILGKRLAKKMNVKVGESVLLFSLKSGENINDFSYKAKRFTISGVFESKMAQYDDIICYISYKDAEEITGLTDNQATHLEIMLNDVTQANYISRQMEKFLGYPIFAQTVFDLHQSIFSWIELQKEPIPIILGLIIIIAAFNIITTLLILVIEKVHSIAILRAMGMQKSEIIKIFIRLGVMIGLKGSLIGSGIALIFSILQQTFELVRLNGDIYFLDVLPIEINLMQYILVIIISFVLSFLATLIPAIVAAKMNPLQAFRFK
ncbi:MAG: hypothetical protein A2X64_06870 [Ignavibacteria bacterium GWF2_33_9]|nr:MAG: hypothetical protein A2X64_06870 [Ignavibacteria bacterium GWF2_33_9]